MAPFDVVHVKEQGEDLIIVIVAPAFEFEAAAKQQALIATLTACAHKAGLAGTVVPVWQKGSTFGFLAPTPWHPFFRSLTPALLAANVNTKLTCA
jgi:hypothetical protein